MAPIAVSPAGWQVAFVALDADENRLVWIHSRDALAPKRLNGTENAGWPFWLPDGRYVGFLANGKLKNVEATGGAAMTVCDAENTRGSTCFFCAKRRWSRSHSTLAAWL